MPTVPKSIALLALASVVTHAQLRAQTTALQGTYSLTGDGSAEIKRAIDHAVAGMNFVVRPVARARLRKTNVPYESIQIRFTGGQVTIDTRNGHPITTPANGSTIAWKREDGEVFRVSTEWRNGALQQTFVAADGQRVNVFTLGPDASTMEMLVTVTSPRLNAPVTYALRYHRDR